MTDWEDVGEFSPDHHGDEFSWIQLRRRRRADQTPITQDRDTVGQPEDFVHLMGGVDDGDAACLQSGDGAEEGRDLVVRKGGGRFVHQDDVSLAPERLGDLNHLSLGHGQRAHHAGRIDIRFKFAQQFFGARQLGGSIDESEAGARLGTEGNILRYRQIRDGHQFLMDHRDARDQGIVWRGELGRAFAPFDLTAVGAIESGDNLHQRRLAGAVLAHQGVHFAWQEVDRRRM